jgi:hypothetical protein
MAAPAQRIKQHLSESQFLAQKMCGASGCRAGPSMPSDHHVLQGKQCVPGFMKRSRVLLVHGFIWSIQKLEKY